MKIEISMELLRQTFDYRDGALYWKVRLSNRTKIGDLAGTIGKEGYTAISVFGSRDRVHRLIWIWHFGPIPANILIDHRDRNPSNNRIENLRLADPVQNSCNQKINSVNKSGYKGVFFVPHAKKWRAQISSNNKVRSLGYFDSPEAASIAYKVAADIHHGDFANYKL